MAIFAGISGLISVLVGWVITYRLFSLARKTEAQPERLLAITFCGLYCVGYPLAGASRAPGLSMTNEGSLLFVMGAIGMVVGIAALGRFPLVVFRPGQLWAQILSGLIASAGLIAGVGCASAVAFADTREEMLSGMQTPSILLMGTVGLSFGWHGFESTRYYLQMRRRLALGLANPETTHRFLLWSLASWSAVLPIVANTILRASGVPILSPVPMAIIALSSLITSSCWWLSFFMPDRYRNFILRPAQATPSPS